MEIYPDKYDQLELNTVEKSFIRTLDRAMVEEQLAYYVLHINPRRLGIEGGKPELFNLLVLKEGIVLFRFFPEADVYKVGTTLTFLSNSFVYDKLKNDIYEKLENSRYLIDKNNELLFDCNICYVFASIESTQVASYLNEETRRFCNKHVLFKDSILDIRKNGACGVKKYINSRNGIKEEIVNNIFQRLCPEITIPRKYFLNNNESVKTNNAAIDYSDRAVIAYRLKNSQINIINKIKKGDQLVLACAGSGKSVLLISKCFKLASLNPNEKFLITCYNRNLKSYYEWAIAQAGFMSNTVKCQTFYGLCYGLLESNHLVKPSQGSNQEEYYEALFLAANKALSENKIKERFCGIFIDEVQIFKPEWYRFCFNLLKDKKTDGHFFVIAGDKSQDIKNNIRNGKAPWQGHGEDYPEFRGKTIPIEYNYRNSKPINNAIDSFIDKSKIFARNIGVDMDSDPELFLRGRAVREGNQPTVVELSDRSNSGEIKAIIRAVKEMLNRGLSEVDIAIILYNRTAYRKFENWKDSVYSLENLKQAFINEGWESPAVLISRESDGTTYGSRRGLTIATIEGSLGLDFPGVILAGLLPLGIHENVKNQQDVLHCGEHEAESYKKNINFIYTGCTRAKDELTIILSEPRGASIYMDLIRDSIGKV